MAEYNASDFTGKAMYAKGRVPVYRAVAGKLKQFAVVPAGMLIGIIEYPVRVGVYGNPHVLWCFKDKNGAAYYVSQSAALNVDTKGVKTTEQRAADVAEGTALYNTPNPFTDFFKDLKLSTMLALGIGAYLIFKRN